MQYITHKRFKAKCIFGDVNLPAMTECYTHGSTTHGDVICYDNNPICATTSQNAHEYFARNDDGQGMLRGKLTSAIVAKLSKRDKDYQARWDKVWDDAQCQKYRRTEHDDHWLWNHDFYNADILTLKYIASLVGAKEV